jgi:hypothetical protein
VIRYLSLFCVIARKVSGEKGGSYEGVSSLTMALTVIQAEDTPSTLLSTEELKYKFLWIA